MSARTKLMTSRTLVRLILVVAVFPLIPMIISGQWNWWEAWVYAAVSILGSWALIENQFFSGVVRIQKDRGHHVVSTGPYRFIRHPGYAGTMWVFLATPVLLDSVWAFLPALFLIGILILRTALEDQTPQEELPGYKQYAQKTRFRLVAGLW